jgi:tRNA pseudouridine55 synthase
VTDSGLLVVDKPGGMTSHDVVARLRRTLGTRKVGHAGTLDPMATGVLVIGFGRATRLLGHLLLADKTYVATVRLGQTTTTDDAEGDVTATTPTGDLSEDAVRAALAGFVGAIQQVPSTVSAIKVDGKRAYQRARDGEEVVLPAREVTVRSAEAVNFCRDGDFLDFELRLSCSTGTYVRAIARDLGALLGVGGHLTALRRTSVGPFTLDQAAVDLEHVDVAPLGELARVLFPTVDVDEDTAMSIGYGRKLELVLPSSEGPVAMISPTGELLALYEQRDDLAVPVAVLV